MRVCPRCRPFPGTESPFLRPEGRTGIGRTATRLGAGADGLPRTLEAAWFSRCVFADGGMTFLPRASGADRLTGRSPKARIKAGCTARGSTSRAFPGIAGPEWYVPLDRRVFRMRVRSLGWNIARDAPRTALGSTGIRPRDLWEKGGLRRHGNNDLIEVVWIVCVRISARVKRCAPFPCQVDADGCAGSARVVGVARGHAETREVARGHAERGGMVKRVVVRWCTSTAVELAVLFIPLNERDPSES